MLVFGYVYYAMYIEADFFRVGRPFLVAETICVPAILLGIEREVARAYGVVVYFHASRRLLYLQAYRQRCSWTILHWIKRHS